MTNKTKNMRVPEEFEIFIDTHSKECAKQTGMPENKLATMRRMADKLEGRLITKGFDFDFAIFGKTKKKR